MKFKAGVVFIALAVVFFAAYLKLHSHTVPAKSTSVLASTNSRSVIFMYNMTCRACTMMMKIKLGRADGVSWLRFNYPLRLLTIYHEPSRINVGDIKKFIDGTGEFSAALLSTSDYGDLPEGEVARWTGETISTAKALGLLETFRSRLDDQMGSEPSVEKSEALSDALGERIRTALLANEAREAGYGEEKVVTGLPEVLAKDFYWPKELIPPTPEEAMVGAFVLEGVMKGDEGEQGRAAFDRYLLELYKRKGFVFYSETLLP